MTAPQQKDLFTKKWRTVKRLDPLECQIQISLIAQLRIRCRRDVTYWHTPNGEERDDRVASKLKAMGTMPGVADLLFIWPGPAAPQLLFLELKAPRRTTSAEQDHFAERARATGAFYEVADNIDDAIAILKSYGLLAR